MKFSRTLLVVALVFIGFSCSKDDEPNSALEDASLSFGSRTEIVALPTALKNSTDPNALTAVAWVAMANSMSGFSALFVPQSGAVKTTSPIVAANGRVSATQQDYIVYTWSDASFGAVAYQISDQGDKYVFEYFYKFPQTTDWLCYLYAEERKDRSEGLMKVYDVFDNASDVVFQFNWSRVGSLFQFIFTNSQEDFLIKLEVNEQTNAGSLEYTIDGNLQQRITWLSNGTGTWTHFNDAGEVVDTGTF